MNITKLQPYVSFEYEPSLPKEIKAIIQVQLFYSRLAVGQPRPNVTIEGVFFLFHPEFYRNHTKIQGF
jgi:hypothetical protein